MNRYRIYFSGAYWTLFDDKYRQAVGHYRHKQDAKRARYKLTQQEPTT